MFHSIQSFWDWICEIDWDEAIWIGLLIGGVAGLLYKGAGIMLG